MILPKILYYLFIYIFSYLHHETKIKEKIVVFTRIQTIKKAMNGAIHGILLLNDVNNNRYSKLTNEMKNKQKKTTIKNFCSQFFSIKTKKSFNIFIL